MAETEEQWIDLRTIATPEPRVDPDEAFFSTLRPAAPADPDEAFFNTLKPAAKEPSQMVLADPVKIQKSRVLAATLGMSFGAVYDNVDTVAKRFDERDKGWLNTAKDSLKTGVGDLYVGAARTMERVGVPKAIREAKLGGTNLSMMEFGKQLQEAYMPPANAEEFTFDKMLNPRWWATTPMRSVPTMLSLIPAGIVGAYAGAGTAGAVGLGALGKVVLGSIGASALTRPIESAMEAAGAHEEALARGVGEDRAREEADFVFKRNMALVGMDAAQLATAFLPLRLLGGAANRTLTRRVMSAMGKTGAVGAMEAGEEAFQTGVQQMARGEQMEWNAEMKEGAALGFVFGTGTGVGGSVFSSLTGRLENHMPPNLKEEFQANENAAFEMGLNAEDAKLKAFDRLAETPAGQAYIEKEMGDLTAIAEGKEPPSLTPAEMETAIEGMAEEEAFTIGEEPAEPEPLAGILTDEDIAAIGKGESTIEQALGMEEEIAGPAEEFFISEETYQAAIAGLKEKTGGLHAGIDPTVLGNLTVIGAYHLERTARNFPAWSKAMIQQFGEWIKPYLPHVYRKAKREVTRRVRSKERGVAGSVAMAQQEHVESLVESAGMGGRFKYQGEIYTGAEKVGNNILLKGEQDKLVRGSNEIMQIEEIAPFEEFRGLREISAAIKEVEAVEGAELPRAEVKAQIRRTTGQETLVRMIREDVALGAAFKKAEQVARTAYKAGGKDAKATAKAAFADVLAKAKAKAEMFGFREGFKVSEKLTRKEFVEMFQEQSAMTKATQKMLVGYIEENLPPNMRGRFLDAIVNSVSESKAMGVMGRVDELQEKLTRKELIAQIKDFKHFKGNIAVDYQKKLNDLVGDLNTRTINRQTLLKLSGLIDFAEREGMPSGISPSMRANLERLEQVDVNDMTTEDLQTLVDTARHLTELGKLKLQLQYKYDQRARQKALKVLVDSTRNIDPKLSQAGNTKADKFRAGAWYAHLETLTGQRVPELLDDYVDGENVRIFKHLWDAEQTAHWDKKITLDLVAKELMTLGITELTDEQQVRIMVNIRNQEGAEQATLTLMEKHGFNEVPDLTPQEQGLIDVLKKWSGADVHKVAALYEERENKPFERLPSRILPLKYEGQVDVDLQAAMLNDHHRTTEVQQGFTVARQPGVKKIPRVDVFGVFEQGLDDQKWYVHVQPALDNVSQLIKTKEYVDAAGATGTNWWIDHLDIMARRGWSKTASFNAFSTTLRAARGNLTTAVLGYKVSSIIMQPFAVFDAMAYANGKWGGATALEVFGEVSKAWIVPGIAKAKVEGSPKLQLRAGGEFAVQEALTAARAQASVKNKFVAGGLALMKKADQRTAAGVQQAFENVLTRRGIPNAAHEAEQLVDMVSSSSDISFRPHVLARGELARTAFTFGTFMLNRWAIISHDLIAKGLIKGNWQQRYTAAFGLGVLIAGKIAEDEARKFLFEATTGKELKEKPLFVRLLFSLPSNIPFFGNVFSPFTGGSGTDVPLEKAISDILGASRAISAKKPEAKQRALLKAAEAAITVGAGVPGTAQAFDIIENIFLPEKGGGAKRVDVGD